MADSIVRARVPLELHHQLLEMAAQLQVSPSEIVAAAIRQYLEKLQALDDNAKATDILDRLEQLERRVEVLESVDPRRATVPTRLGTTSSSFLGMQQLVSRSIGLDGSGDPFTGPHFRQADLQGSNVLESNLASRFVERFKGCGPIDLKRCRNWWPARRKPSINEIRDFLHAIVRSGRARWVDTRQIEIL